MPLVKLNYFMGITLLYQEIVLITICNTICFTNSCPQLAGTSVTEKAFGEDIVCQGTTEQRYNHKG